MISKYQINIECEPSINDEYLSKSTTIESQNWYLTQNLSPKISDFSAIELRFAGIHENVQC